MTIDEICRKYGITNYIINDDGTIDVNGDVDLYKSGLKRIPVIFNRVDGYFNCGDNGLTSLKGSPKWVGSYFDCDDNKLTSLEFSPDYVGGSFDCSSNNLTDLIGSPKEVVGSFYCSSNNLTDLIGSPKEVGVGFYCSDNPNLITPKGCPEKIGTYFSCTNTPLEYIFNNVDRFFLYTFNFYKIIKDDTVNLKRLKYVMDLYDKRIDLEEIQKYYILV